MHDQYRVLRPTHIHQTLAGLRLCYSLYSRMKRQLRAIHLDLAQMLQCTANQRIECYSSESMHFHTSISTWTFCDVEF